MNNSCGWLPLLLILFCQTVAANYQQLPVSYAFADEIFSPEQAENLSFRTYDAATPLEQHPHGVVLRVQLPNQAVQQTESNLILRPKYLSEVTGWFKQTSQTEWHSTQRGRLLPNKPAYYSTQDLVFELDQQQDLTAPVYFLLRDNGAPKPISISLVPRQQYLLDDVAFSRYTAALYGIILVLAVINLIFYLFVRAQPFFFYSIYMLSALNALLWQEGWIGKIILLPDVPTVDRWLLFFTLLPVIFFYQFYRSCLALSWETLMGKVLLGFQLGFIAILTLALSDSFFFNADIKNIWIILFNGLLALGSITLFMITLGYWIKGHRLAGYLFIANTVLIAATLIRISYAFNITPDDSWQAHVFEIALAIDAILLSLALADHTLNIKKERDHAQGELVRIDTAYQQEQFLADFVRQVQLLGGNDDPSKTARMLDKLLFKNIYHMLTIAEVMVLTLKDSSIHYRCLGDNRILGKLFKQWAKKQLPELIQDCRSGRMHKKPILDFLDTRERYQYLMIPVETRENMDYCLILLVSQQQFLDRERIAELSNFIGKAVHALMEAETMERLRHSARYDSLTGVLNRASMESYTSKLLLQCSNGGKGLALAFVDLDFFKKINDTLGHDFGDDCLKLLCKTIQETLPQQTTIGRFGGDEFLLLLPDMDYQQAHQQLAKLNPALKTSFKNKRCNLSVSIGIAECLAGQQITMPKLLKRADRSLYAAKAEGRTCIGPKA